VLRVSYCVRDGIRFAVPQPTKWQRIGNQIDAAFIFAQSSFVSVAVTALRLSNLNRRFGQAANYLDMQGGFSQNATLMKTPSILIILSFVCFGLLSRLQAVSPAPDGGYANGNTAEGDGALASLTTGPDNTAIGFAALFSNTTAGANTAVGYQALYNNTGSANTATGYLALFSNTTGIYNTAIGEAALSSNTTGNNNTATGEYALDENTTGSANTADGRGALTNNTTGFSNTATGHQALYSNNGNENTADGFGALFHNTTGGDNAATGFQTLYSNTTGICNAAAGGRALYLNTIGARNTASGFQALYRNTAGSYNIALGNNAGFNLTTGSNNIEIGNAGVADEANTIRIGTTGTQQATFIAGISGATVAGNAVIVNNLGQLGVAPSSARFKDEIKPMDKVSEAILTLKPVTFHYKKEIDPKSTAQFGLVAEEVVKVNPDLVAPDGEGKPYTVRYDAVNAMLLNEFLKEHRKVEELQANIAQQRKYFDAAVADLKGQIQKVSAQVELSKTAPQTVLNNH
jgi:hypothetical protein